MKNGGNADLWSDIFLPGAGGVSSACSHLIEGTNQKGPGSHMAKGLR